MSHWRSFVCGLAMLTPWSAVARAGLTASEIMWEAQQQLSVPAESALGEMDVYRGDTPLRHYAFVLGKLWEPQTTTESVRIDFETAINSAPDSASLYPHHRYLLKRTAETPPSQWLYLPALRRVRITPYHPDDPLVQSHYLFYDLTTILDFDDYRYRLVDASEQAPVVEGEPQTAFVPYQRTVFSLERRGETYLVTQMIYVGRDTERQARFLDFREIAPRRFRPGVVVVEGDGGRTEIRFRHWAIHTPAPQLFTPAALETRMLEVPLESTDE